MRTLRKRHTVLFLAVLLIVPATPALAQTAEPAYDHPLFTGPAHTAPTPRFDQEHLRLALRFDEDTHRLFGDARLRLAPLDPGRLDAPPDTLVLAAAGLAIDSVLIGESLATLVNTPFRIGQGDSVLIALDSLPAPSEPFEVRLFYSASPRRGLFFVRPTSRNPTQKQQIWTENAPGAIHHWIPLLDAPGDRLTSELLVTADSSLHVLSNGRLVEVIDGEDGAVTSYYRQDEPHPPDQVMLVVGDYEAHRNSVRFATVDPSVSLSYRVYPEYVGAVARTFGRTPAMMQFFVESLEVPYPWTAYDQVILPQFYGDAQAYAGATTFSDRFVLDERAALSENTDGLVARMLARQWFGSLVSARYWSDAWLDDGFAAYLSALFVARHQGDDAFSLTMLGHADGYLAEARHYRRPLVWNRWNDPSDLFDAHGRCKGAWVLHMLRHRIGDALFWKVLDQYLTTYAFKSVDTADFKRVVRGVTGENFDAFFAQWMEAAGHPVLDVRYSYDADEGQLVVGVTQAQEGYLVPPVFRMPLVLQAHTLTDVFRFEVTLENASQVFTLPLAGRPRFVVVDPGHDLLAEVRVDQPARAWMGQLRHALNPVSRVQAARALMAFSDDPALPVGLRSALGEEPSAAVREAIVRTISRLPPSSATQRLLFEAAGDAEAPVRAAAFEALGAYENAPEVHDLAFKAAQDDPSYAVQAAAVKTLARTAAPTALAVVRSALITPSHREVIRRAAFEALALLEVPARDGLALGLEYSAAGHPTDARIAAIDYLRLHASETRSALDRLLDLLSDDDVRVRRAVIASLGGVATGRALEALRLHQATETQPALQAALKQALRQHPAANE